LIARRAYFCRLAVSILRGLLCTKSATPDRKSLAISKDAEQRYGGQAGRRPVLQIDSKYLFGVEPPLSGQRSTVRSRLPTLVVVVKCRLSLGFAFQKEPSRILLARRPGRSLDRQLLGLAIDPYRQKFLLLSPALPAQAKFR